MDEKVLKILKETKGYVSGAEIGERLGVSRSAIWKSIKKLQQDGYEIDAISNRGYSLKGRKEVYNEVQLKDGISAKVMGKEILFYDEIDSTSTRVRQLALLGKPEGLLVVAEKQNAGRGRLGRMWQSEKGAGIYMSLLLRPNLPPNEGPMITLLSGMSVVRAIKNVTGLLPDIKWPNDILLNGKKICGILTEMDAEMDKIHSIALGIGINVNTREFPSTVSNFATSLKIESGKEYSRTALLQEILCCFEKDYNEFLKNGGFACFYDAHKENCITIGKSVSCDGKYKIEGVAVDITPQGELVVRTKEGIDVVIFSGEVSITPK